MTQKERWGKKFVDKRNWKIYNEELVMRGEFFLDLHFLNTWNKEIAGMNHGKTGRPFEYTNSYIKFQAVLHEFLDYRGIEGFTRKLSEYVPKLPVNEYSTICRRVNKLEECVELPKNVKKLFVAYDSSGIKVSNRGEWIRKKWKTKRGWIKANIVVDVKKKKLLSLETTLENVSDADMFEKQIGELVRKGVGIEKAAADGAMDHRSCFNKLKQHRIKPVIKVRKNASSRARGSPARARAVREFKKKGYKKWAHDNDYGQRWASEGMFSSVKRKFGEAVRATKSENMLKEAAMKFIHYEWMKEYAKS